jgi:hypothetical protein
VHGPNALILSSIGADALLLLRNLVKAEGAFATIVGIPDFLSKYPPPKSPLHAGAV